MLRTTFRVFFADQEQIVDNSSNRIRCTVNPLLSNDPGKVDSNFFCYTATVLSPHRNVLIFTQRRHKPT